MSIPSQWTVLLLGGTGKVSSRIAPLLAANGYTTLMASRSGTMKSFLPNCHGVKFDWFDQSTWTSLFTSTPNISAIFLVAPPVLDCVPIMKSFIELAITHHVKRLVLLSASLMEVGDGPSFGEISGYVARFGVEYTVLRPTWFMENFSEMQHLPTISDQDMIVTTTGEGKVPFVSAEDIAECAFRALTDAKSHDTDHLILGPELLSYDQIAEIFTKALGRKITHVKITEDESIAALKQYGVAADYAQMLADLDTAIREGKEKRLNDVVLKVTGHNPKKFEAYLEDCMARGAWNKTSIKESVGVRV
ncbi:Agroclavine dehydrogenase [Hyphodiscus hymeniophilus]|uniref:Agroclavine dehydrogenase n=1 Tax=Hyphodiscus hymeniophilus TaxID=353542 RepID=A0A9P7B0D4_9HELO|nr:Agroclavine dehydrogenase [Hyphodiscus hymeniophilus]